MKERLMGAITILILPIVCYIVYKPLKDFLRCYLTTIDSLPHNTVDALYVLGGSTKSTYKHLVAAANLYNKKKTRSILLFSKEPIGESPVVHHRNLTTNEWEILQLKNRGIPDSDICLILVHKGFFGTLSEAKDLSRYFKNNRYQSVILISSPCHSRRVAMIFKHYLKSSRMDVFVQGSDDPFYLSELVIETLKIQVYKILTLLLN
jgi:uncharacterized SAM-binding protein YcdF (DUF218 family)